MIRILIPAFVVIQVLAVSAAGQEPESARRTREALARLGEVDPSLLGDWWFGLYMGDVNGGSLHLSVREAETPGYEVRSELKMTVPGVPASDVRVLHLAPDLSLVRATAERAIPVSTPSGIEIRKRTEKTRREGGTWVFEVAEEKSTVRYAVEGPARHHTEIESLLLLLGLLGGKEGDAFLLEGVSWPDPRLDRFGEGSGQKDAVETGPLTRRCEVVFGATREIAPRGKAVLCREVSVRSDGRSRTFLVSSGGRVETVASFMDEAFTLVRGTEAEAKADLPSAARGGAEAEAVIGRVMAFLEVRMGLSSFEKLDEIVDWEAYKKSEGERNPEVGAMSMPEFKKRLAAWMKEPASMPPPEALKFMRKVLRAEVSGDVAEVFFPGEEKCVARLGKTSGSWRITYFKRAP